MALFVHPENQKILWNIISGNPFIIQYFESKPPHVKETWFKQSIEDFYKRIQDRKIDPQELNYLNKEVLTNMIHTVHMKNPEFSAHNSSQIPTSTPTPPPTSTEYGSNRYSESNNVQAQQWHSPQSLQYQHPQKDPLNVMNSINTPAIINESKEEIFNKQFKMRQQEYDNMLQRKVPNEINFRDPVSDENKDISELLERERREREELMRPIQQQTKINIQGDNNITLDAVELNEPKEKKSVSWVDNNKTNNIHELVEVQKSEMYSMRLHIIELTKQIEATNKRLSELELRLHENTSPTSEKPQPHVTSKYANLDEKKSSVIIQNTGDVLVETVESDSDSSK